MTIAIICVKRVIDHPSSLRSRGTDNSGSCVLALSNRRHPDDSKVKPILVGSPMPRLADNDFGPLQVGEGFRSLCENGSPLRRSRAQREFPEYLPGDPNRCNPSVRPNPFGFNLPFLTYLFQAFAICIRYLLPFDRPFDRHLLTQAVPNPNFAKQFR